jgi:hypothetical protein
VEVQDSELQLTQLASSNWLQERASLARLRCHCTMEEALREALAACLTSHAVLEAETLLEWDVCDNLNGMLEWSWLAFRWRAVCRQDCLKYVARE